MKNLTEQQLLDNYQRLLNVVEENFSGDRKDKILEMYKFFEDRIVVAPASGKPNYHFCFVGGYVEHVLHIVETAKELVKVYEKVGGTIDFTMEELVFTALHHDLGKVGDLDGEYYLPQDDDWRRKKLNEWFTQNTDISYMSVTDRALYLLQHFGIKITQQEWIGIKCSDGMYDDANIQYFKTFKPEHAFESALPYIIHWADHMATVTEKSQWKHQEDVKTKKVNKSVGNIKQAVKTEVETKLTGDSPKDLFDELFGEKK
jgi:hypothetical protein